MAEPLTVQVASHIARVTLARPDVHNALDPELIRALAATIMRLGGEEDIRVLVLAGAGKSLCAGLDLQHMQQTANFTREQNFADAVALAELFHTLRRCPKPIITRAQGAVYGGGLGLVAASDLAGALRDARFSLSEVKLGLVPSIIAPFCLERMGTTAYRRYALTAEVFDGAEAKRIGLVCETADTVHGLDAWITNTAGLLVKNGPQALARCKAEAQAVAELPWSQVRDFTARTIADLRVSAEGQEGVRAFLEKRPPSWIAK